MPSGPARDLERRVVRRILGALEDLPSMEHRQKVLRRLAALHGPPPGSESADEDSSDEEESFSIRNVVSELARDVGRPRKLRKPKGERPKDPPQDSPGGSFSAVSVGAFRLEDLA